MDSTILVSVSSIESAWIRLSENYDYQQVVKSFFRARSFYKGAFGLFAGTRKADGRRAVYCNAACAERLTKELAERVRAWLPAPTSSQCPPTEDIEDVQPLNLKSEEEVKRFLKDLKRAARYQKLSHQLSAAQTLLLQVRRWTAPFSPPPLSACAAAPVTRRTNLSDEVEWPPLSGAAVCRTPPSAARSTTTPATPQRLASDCEDGPSGRSRTLSSTATADGAGSRGVGGGPSRIQIQANAGGAGPLGRQQDGSDSGGPEQKPVGGAVAALRSEVTASEGQLQQPPTTATSGTKHGGALLATTVDSLTVQVACATVSTIAKSEADGPLPTAAAAAASDGCPSRDPSRMAPPSCGRDDRAGRAGSGGGSLDEDADAGQFVVFCCIDLEWWERDNARVTEVGWTLWDNLTLQLESRHYIVLENEAYLNGTYVPNHKYDFQFGTSVNRPLADAAAALQRDLQAYGECTWARWWALQAAISPIGAAAGAAVASSAGAPGDNAETEEAEAAGSSAERFAATGGSAAAEQQAESSAGTRALLSSPPPPPAMPRMQLVVVGHGLSGDLKALSSLLGVTIPAEAAIVDTADLAWAALGAGDGQGNSGQRQAMSLRVLLKTLGIPAMKLHNGGNDARYTMEAMLALAALDPSSYLV